MSKTDNAYIAQVSTFWENAHRKDLVAHLSGVEYKNAISFLQAAPFVKPKGNALEVGVGMGHVTKGLRDAGMNVSAVDISMAALKRVEPYCNGLFHVADVHLLPSNHFDLITCVNVVQHIRTDVLEFELQHFVRSMKRSGVMAIQFVANKNHEDLGENATQGAMTSGNLCRSPDFMEELFKKLNCKVDHVFKKWGINKGMVNGNHVFHVRRVK